MTTAPTRRHTTRRLAAILTVLLLGGLLPTLPAQAGSDYEQVVDITFPLAQGTPVRYGDDYDHCRRTSGSTCVRHHQSTDLMVALGTPVYAVADGRISWRSGSTAGPPSYGWMLYLDGDDGRRYAYVHLGTQDGPLRRAYAPGTEAGTRVTRGQLLGWAGCSGSASCDGGEHLHFEIHDDRVTDPYDYHDHERINPFPSLRSAEARGAYPDAADPSGRRFRDVGPTSTHGSAIARLAEAGVTRGCGGDEFCPGDSVTRAQMASFIVSAAGLESRPDGPTFRDVSATNVHRNSIRRLAAHRITRGCEPDLFCPSGPVTRGQMATFLASARNLPPGEPGQFDDVSDGHTHAASIAALAQAGITSGCEPRKFCPDEPVSRGQMATFLVKAFGL